MAIQRRLTIFTAWVILAVVALIGGVAKADSAGADRLRSEIWEFINMQNALTFAELGDVYRLDGLEVTSAGDGYDVLLRNLRMAEEGENGGAFEIGDITFRMTPAGDQLYRMTDLVLPNAMTLRDADGSGAVMTANLTRFDGLWSARYLSFLSLDSEFASAGLAPLNEPGAMGAGRISVILDSVELSEGIFDQKASFEVLGIALKAPDQGDFSIGRIAAASNAKQVNLAATADNLRLIVKDRKAALKQMTGDDVRAMLPWLGDMEMKLQKLSIADKEGNSFSLDEMRLGGRYDAGPGSGGLGSAGFDMAFLGIKAVSPSGDFEGLDSRLVPDRFTLSLGILDIPNDALWNMLIDAAYQGLEGGDSGTGGFEGEAMAGLMAASGTRLLLNELSFSNQIMALAGTGEFRLSEAAAYFIEGGFVFELLGISELQALAQEMVVSGDPQKQENGQALLGTLGMMMIYSQGPETPTPTVPEATAFAIRLTPEGTVLINGLPVFGAQ
ncbi:hypothetical protein [Limibacillus halophilus]|uniref:Uncharacterized protein n=1 Tax=Limibacillus halophilus TaxID=1579333 RepID=A0A839SUA2_9PROT|nr:hypothetical protein [Limibacillus halophilus]MBB3066397.1 hypothetical protein [Limibacillus halophilus]